MRARVPHPRLRIFLLAVGTTLSIAAAVVIFFWGSCAKSVNPYVQTGSTYIGSAACATCHAATTARWRGSHHDLAMQAASDSTVSGDFGGAQLEYAGVVSTFTRRGGKYFVRTDGPDGSLHDYEIEFTFGVSPLQQYLIRLPGGRLQALDIAWDTRPKSAGGQRWFQLYPDELHWTSIRQNWNYSCAECHSTNVKKNYDAAANRFRTTFSATNVGCEACHGPGSEHVKSRGKIAFAAITRANEVERCARCHSARAQFTDEYVPARPLGDSHRVSLIDQKLYYPDGQVRGEAYEYGSFVQSTMFAKGVTCSDCHDSHTGKLRAAGSQVCARCHAAEKYQAASHTFHEANARGPDCVSCHMPATTYNGVQARHDHSIRIPRPDLSVSLGVPNACSNCHGDRGSSWAAKRIVAWYGHEPPGPRRYADAFAAAERNDSNATRLLLAVAGDLDQPPIARATALERLASRLDPSLGGAINVIRAGLYDANPLVRRAAVTALAESDSALRVQMLSPLLNDVVRSVRMEAARSLAAASPVDLDEYIAAERFNADRPESRFNLSLLFVAQHRYAEAERELRSALALDGKLMPAFANLADLYRAMHRERDGEQVLRSAMGAR